MVVLYFPLKWNYLSISFLDTPTLAPWQSFTSFTAVSSQDSLCLLIIFPWLLSPGWKCSQRRPPLQRRGSRLKIRPLSSWSHKASFHEYDKAEKRREMQRGKWFFKLAMKDFKLTFEGDKRLNVDLFWFSLEDLFFFTHVYRWESFGELLEPLSIVLQAGGQIGYSGLCYWHTLIWYVREMAQLLVLSGQAGDLSS